MSGNNGPKLKICGLMRPEDAIAVRDAKADFAGFIFYKKSRRYIMPQCAAELKKLLGGISAVGVFVNSPLDEIAEICRIAELDVVQLHGDESNDFIASLRPLLPDKDIKIWKAVRVREGFDPAVLSEYSVADRLLLDAYVDGYGGKGRQIPRELIENIDFSAHILAGGLTPENIKNAADTFHPYALDISSGVETDGKKDREKILRTAAAL